MKLTNDVKRDLERLSQRSMKRLFKNRPSTVVPLKDSRDGEIYVIAFDDGFTAGLKYAKEMVTP